LFSRAIPFARDLRFCRIRAEEFLDLGQDFVGVLQHLVIPEAQDAVAARSEIRCLDFVVLRLIRMLAAIDLNDDSTFDRTEVGEVRTNRKLTAELNVAQSPASKMTPENLFSWRLLST
jgi:hypothetical protein